jgi:hypothetical protein
MANRQTHNQRQGRYTIDKYLVSTWSIDTHRYTHRYIIDRYTLQIDTKCRQMENRYLSAVCVIAKHSVQSSSMNIYVSEGEKKEGKKGR